MEITEVRIKLMEEQGERLKAFCSITFDDCFVVRDLKVIEGTNGPFVAMPSRKLTSHCPRCRSKNHLRALHCNQCGSSLSSDRMPYDNDGRAKLYADIAHPINSSCREMIQNVVIEEFQSEVERAEQPDYVSRYDDFDVDYDDSSPAHKAPPSQATQAQTTQARIDQAHGKHESHTPRSGGPSSQAVSKDQGPVPTPQSVTSPSVTSPSVTSPSVTSPSTAPQSAAPLPGSGSQPQLGTEGDFGSGIFPES